MKSTSTASSTYFLANHTCAVLYMRVIKPLQAHAGYQIHSNVMCGRCAICALESCITIDQSAIFVIPPMIGFILYREKSCYKVGICVLC